MEQPENHRVPRRDAEAALQRAQTDAAWLGALRRAYEGRHDVLDALWWAAHPLTSTPAGLADPAEVLRELQRAVYSRAAQDSPIVEVEDPATGAPLRLREAELQLQAAQRVLDDDGRMLATALAAIRPEPVQPLVDEPAAPVAPVASVAPVREPSRALSTGTGPPTKAGLPARTAPPDRHSNLEPATIPVEAFQRHRDGSPAPATRSRRKFVAPVLAGVALLFAVLVLPSLTGVDTRADTGSGTEPAQTFTPDALTRTRVEIVPLLSEGNVSDPLEVLARPESETDRPPPGIGDGFEPGSFRRLPNLVAHLQLYLARGEEPDSICLLVLPYDGGGSSACMPETRFAQQGIALGSSGVRYQAGPDLTIMSESITLDADGDLHYSGTARQGAERSRR